MGLPNVGKSTFYNLVVGGCVVPAENYPFCTIEPHSSNIMVPDARLDSAAQIIGSKKTIYATITMVDIAGLIEGASKGEGLGNAFLKNIESCDILLHMVRCFEHGDIIHVMNRVNPMEDIRIINTELLLADMQKVESKLERVSRKALNDKKSKDEAEVAAAVLALLNEERRADEYIPDSPDKERIFKEMRLLSAMPMLYVCNVSDDDASTGNKWVEEVAAKYGKDNVMFLAPKLEADIFAIENHEERRSFMEEMGLGESSLQKIIRLCYTKLRVHSFFTVGPQEARAWTIGCGASAFDAAGEIHTDFQKGFIRAEVIACADYIKHKGEQGCKSAGVARVEGKEYTVRDGDIMHFRFNV